MKRKQHNESPGETFHKKIKSNETLSTNYCCLSDDVLSNMFSFCDATDLCHHIALVCHKWNHSQYQAWKELYKSKYGPNLPVGFSSTDQIDPELQVSQEQAYKFFYRVKSQYRKNLYVSESTRYGMSDFPDKESESSWFVKQVLSSGLRYSIDGEPFWPDLACMLGEEEDSVDDHEFTQMTVVDRLTHLKYYVYTYELGNSVYGAAFLGKGTDDTVSVMSDAGFYECDQPNKHQDDLQLRNALNRILSPLAYADEEAL